MEDTINIRKEVLRKVARDVLESAQVPRTQHLKVVKALADTVKAHEDDRKSFRETLKKVASAIDPMKKKHEGDLEKLQQQVLDTLKVLSREIERSSKIVGEKGDQGEPGDPGKDAIVEEEHVIKEILKRVKVPKGEKGDPGKDAELNKEEVFNEFVTLIIKNRLIDARSIKGLNDFVKDGVKYRVEELMHGGGTKEYVPTGTIDGTNTVFTLPFASSNWKVYADGARARAPKDYSIAGTTLTFVFAPTTTVICDN